jgi:hypothetical protein
MAMHCAMRFLEQKTRSTTETYSFATLGVIECSLRQWSIDMKDDKVIHIWDRYKPRKSDDTTTAIRRLLLRRRFKAGERVHYYGNEARCGTVTEA